MADQANSDPNIFFLPDLGEGLEEAELIEWCVEVGQHVNEFDVVARMETDKALVEVPSPRAGTIAQLHGKPGEKVKVHSPLVTYQSGAAQPSRAARDPMSAAVQRTMDPEAHPHAEKHAETREPNRRASKGESKSDAEKSEDAATVVGAMQSAPTGETAKVIATPAVRRMARDAGVDLGSIHGTGIGGRVTERDVHEAAAASSRSGNRDRGNGNAIEPPPAARPPMRERPAAGAASDADTTRAPGRGNAQEPTIRIPFRGVRRTIAEHLRYSVDHAVHFAVMDEVDVTVLDVLRRRLANASGEKVSFLAFVSAAMAKLLSGRAGAAFGRLNSLVDDEKNEIVQHRSVHLGIATDTEAGLMVPVIHDAELLGVLELQRKINQLAKAARERTIPRNQLSGSTFTISNFGSLGGRFAMPIINYPESGILALGRGREGVVVRDGMMGIGKLLPLSLTADHRVIDGGLAATALAKLIELLLAPEQLLPSR